MSDNKTRSDAPAVESAPMPATMKSAAPPAGPVSDTSANSDDPVVTLPSPNTAPTEEVAAPKRALPAPPPPRSKLPSKPIAKPPPPAETKRTPTFTDKKKDDLDLHSLFDVDAHPEEIHVEPDPEDDAEAKRKAARASRPDQRELSRSRKIPVDEDLFNLSASLFGNQPLTPLVAPDISALAPGLSKGLAEPDKPKAAPAAGSDKAGEAKKEEPVAPLFLVPTTSPREPQKTNTGGIDIDIEAPVKGAGVDKKRMIIGAAVVVLIAAGAFFAGRGSGSKTDTPELAANDKGADSRTGTEATDPGAAAGLETRKGAETAIAPSPAPSPAAGTTGASNAGASSGEKPAVAAQAGAPRGDVKDKPPAGDKPPEKAPELAPTATSTGNKAQSLAEAMAAANAGGATTKAAPPPPPAGGGGDFSTSAASSALGAAAGRAAGCKKDGDPSGVARVSVTFAPSGRATRAVVNGPPFAGTPTGGCIAAAFRSSTVPAFSGDPVTVSKSVTIR